MPKVHRVGDQRLDGAVTVSTGKNTKVLVEGQLAAVLGDLSSHNMLGALISMTPGKVLVQGIPMIVALQDDAAPDSEGINLHPQSMPTPATGSSKVNAYSGSFGGGLGSFNSLVGMPQLGELLSFGGQIVGQVSRSAPTGTGSGVLVMNNTTANTQPTTGSTVTGVTSGKTFTFSNYFTS